MSHRGPLRTVLFAAAVLALSPPTPARAVDLSVTVDLLSSMETADGTVWSVAFLVRGPAEELCNYVEYQTVVETGTIRIETGFIPILPPPCPVENGLTGFETSAIDVPEGVYTVEVFRDGELLGAQMVAVPAIDPFVLVTDPEPPVEGEPFELTILGTWIDSCVPRPGSVEVVGDVVRVDTLGPGCDDACLAVLTDYELDVGSLGPLDDGTYDVVFRVLSCSGESFIGVKPLDVVPRLGLPQCEPAPRRLCLDSQPGDRRFTVEAIFRTEADGPVERARPVAAIPEGALSGGLLWFFEPRNPEILVKVLDGCAVNGHHWVYLAATTDVGFELVIEDEVTGAVWSTSNEVGDLAVPVADVEALPCV